MAAADLEGALQVPRHKMLAAAQRQLQGHVLQTAHGDHVGGERAVPQMLPLQRLHMPEELRRGLERQGGDRDRQQVHLGHHPVFRATETLLHVRHSEVQQQDPRAAADAERAEQQHARQVRHEVAGEEIEAAEAAGAGDH